MKNDRVFILRESVVKITQMLSGKGIKVTQQGVNAYVKADHMGQPVLVNLPYLPDNATEELCNAIQGFLDHEVAHILFTEFSLMSKAHAKGEQVGFMLNALEDPRIEKEMAKRFQGSAYNLSVTGKFYLDKFVMPRLKEKAAAGDAMGVMQTLMVPMIRALSGQQVFQEFMRDHWTKVEPMYERIKDLQPQIEGATSTADCMSLAEEITKRLTEGSSSSKKKKKEESEEGGSSGKGGKGKGKSKGKGAAGKSDKSEDKSDEEKDESSGEGEGESEKESKSKGAGKGEEKTDEEKPEDEDEKSDKDEKSESEEESDDSGESEPAPDAEDDTDESDVKDADEEEEDEYTGDAEGSTEDGDAAGAEGEEEELKNDTPIWAPLNKEDANDYDESMSRLISESSVKSAMNADYMPFTKDYDLIEKLPIGSGYESSMAKKLMEKVDHMVAPMQKDLERAVAAKSLATRSHGHRSGRLHAANLSRLAFNDDRVFSRKHESTSKDVAVELVVDASGSMSGSKIHTASQAAYALASVLDRLNIKNEVICFTTKDIPPNAVNDLRDQSAKHGVRFSRVEGLYMPILKGYEEKITANVRERFAWLPNTRILRSNVDGECVEIAARRLLAQKQAGKIMIVLSDGYPAAAGSRGDLEQHLIRVVKDVSAAGIKVVGIGIESNAVERFYPKNMVLNSVEQLPAAVIKELRHLLTA